MTNPTCPFDNLECTPNNVFIDMDGYLNCHECTRCKIPAATISETALCCVDPGSPEGDKTVRVCIVGHGPITATEVKSFIEMGIDVVIVGQHEVPGRTITAKLMAPPDIPCFEIEQKKRHQPKGHERPYKFHR